MIFIPSARASSYFAKNLCLCFRAFAKNTALSTLYRLSFESLEQEKRSRFARTLAEGLAVIRIGISKTSKSSVIKGVRPHLLDTPSDLNPFHDDPHVPFASWNILESEIVPRLSMISAPKRSGRDAR